MTEGSIVTFYSYKGGVGRTFALASIGTLLAHWGYRVLCVDWDLEAPGLHLYFKPWMTDAPQPGLLELLESGIATTEINWRDYVTELPFEQAREPLLFMSAGVINASYVRRMQALNWDVLYRDHNFGKFLEDLRRQWQSELDFVLIDSRTGITDIGGICTVQMPDFLVMLFTANLQSINGAFEVIQLARRQRDHIPYDRAKLLVLPVLTRFEGRVEYETAQTWLNIVADTFAPLYADWTDRSLQTEDLLNFTKLPYVPYWSFGEQIPVIAEDSKDPESLGFALETLAAMIALKLAHTETLTTNRERLVADAKRGPAHARITPTDRLWSSENSGIKVFVSYSAQDQEFAEELEKHLVLLQRQGLIRTWQSRIVDRSYDWANTIDINLEESQLILPLVSTDYLASDYTSGVEMRRAMALHSSGQARLLPILVRPVDLKRGPFAEMQVLPRGNHPISTWSDQDAAWINITRGIRKAVTSLANAGVET